jgi:hypothetical protein
MEKGRKTIFCIRARGGEAPAHIRDSRICIGFALVPLSYPFFGGRVDDLQRTCYESLVNSLIDNESLN